MQSKPSSLRLAVLGMIPGNGHPYSWSAIINGYNEKEMARCPYESIPVYLKESRAKIGIPGARVTHVWTDDPTEARHVAAAACIDHVVARPEDVIGEVDAVVIGTDDGADHSRRARPFIEAGLPIFIDKPLATTPQELAIFTAWHRSGARFLSSSGARYDPELGPLRLRLGAAGEIRWVNAVMIKTWEKYGIHRVEPIFTLVGPGFESVVMGPKVGKSEIAHLYHRRGLVVSIAMIEDGYKATPSIRVVGVDGIVEGALANTFDAFKGQLETFVEFVRTGVSPIPFEHTAEMMAVIIAGIESRARGGQRVPVKVPALGQAALSVA